MSLTIRYAATDADVVAIHQFLCVVAAPFLPAPIDGRESAIEVWRVVNHDVALMAMDGDRMVGTLGLVNPSPWWNPNYRYLANRWFFALPGSKAWRPLLKEAKAIARASDLELQIISEERGKVTTFNKSPFRDWPTPPAGAPSASTP